MSDLELPVTGMTEQIAVPRAASSRWRATA
jgi:hypothetical protein